MGPLSFWSNLLIPNAHLFFFFFLFLFNFFFFWQQLRWKEHIIKIRLTRNQIHHERKENVYIHRRENHQPRSKLWQMSECEMPDPWTIPMTRYSPIVGSKSSLEVGVMSQFFNHSRLPVIRKHFFFFNHAFFLPRSTCHFFHNDLRLPLINLLRIRAFDLQLIHNFFNGLMEWQ